MRQLLLIFISILGFQAQIHAQTLSPDANISILTCNPGTEVYSMYGHTAIRVSDPASGLDAVFNYGVFSFEAPKFSVSLCKRTNRLSDGWSEV